MYIELKNKLKKRYGRHWQLQCAVQIEDVKKVHPHVDGERVLQRAHESTQLPFELEIFNDIGFTEKHTEPIDIGPLSAEIQTVYIQAKVLEIYKL